MTTAELPRLPGKRHTDMETDADAIIAAPRLWLVPARQLPLEDAACELLRDTHGRRAAALPSCEALSLGSPERTLVWAIVLRDDSPRTAPPAVVATQASVASLTSSVDSFLSSSPQLSAWPSLEAPVALKSNIIGVLEVALFPVDADISPLLTTSISPEHTSRGYSTEAIKAILLHLFKRCPNDFSSVQSIILDSAPSKILASKILTRIGFSVIGSTGSNESIDGSGSVFEMGRDEFLDLWG
ncbi:hypothetical protein HDU82_005179 [Entophlyctis luteolus]|nr:hypothetical protein HDU82_005179 [Entophlyctis luteolus]